MGCTVSGGVVAPNATGATANTTGGMAPVKQPIGGSAQNPAAMGTGMATKPAVAMGGMTAAPLNNNASHKQQSDPFTAGGGGTTAPPSASAAVSTVGSAASSVGGPRDSGAPSSVGVSADPAVAGATVVITPATDKPKQMTPRLNFSGEQQAHGAQHTPRSTNSVMTGGSTTGTTGTTASGMARETLSPSPGITPREEDEVLNDDDDSRDDSRGHPHHPHAAGHAGGQQPARTSNPRPNPLAHNAHTAPAFNTGVPSMAAGGAAVSGTNHAALAAAQHGTPPRGHRTVGSGSNSGTASDGRAETPGSASMINVQLRGGGIPDSPALDARSRNGSGTSVTMPPIIKAAGAGAGGSGSPYQVAANAPQQRLSNDMGVGGTDSPSGRSRRMGKRAQTYGHYNNEAERKAFENATAAAQGPRVSLPAIAGSSPAGAPNAATAVSGPSASSAVSLPAVAGAQQPGGFNPFVVAANGSVAPGTGAGAGGNGNAKPPVRRRSVPNVVIQPASAQTGGDIDFLPADLFKAQRAAGMPVSGGVDGSFHGGVDPKSPTALKSRLLSHRLGGAAIQDSPERAMLTGAIPGTPAAGPMMQLNSSLTHAAINSSSRRSPQPQHFVTPMGAVAAQPLGLNSGAPIGASAAVAHPPLSPSTSHTSATVTTSANTSPLSQSQTAQALHHAGAAAHAPLNSGHAIGAAPHTIHAAPAVGVPQPLPDAKAAGAAGAGTGSANAKRASLSQTDAGTGSRKSNRFASGNGIANILAQQQAGAAVPPSPFHASLNTGAAAAGFAAPPTPSGANSSRPTSSVGSRSLGRGRGRPVALVVDDVKVTQVVTSAAMFNAGYVSDVAADGLEAVAMAQNTHYEVILMDVALPKIDGVEATRRIRAFEAEHGIAPALIFGLTATVNPVSLEKYRAAGMNACLEKGSVLKESVKVAISLADRNGYFFINSRNQTVLNLADVVETGAPSKTVPETTAEH